MRLLLASASPARAETLRRAGIDPLVAVSDVDEDALVRDAQLERGPLSVEEVVELLARAKAEAVLRTAAARDADLVVGCDSLLDLDGEAMGKPGTADRARRRWLRMRGREAVLRTGHWVRMRDGRARGAVSATTVRFADVGEDEIDAYVATGEPLRVAGAFTIDGLGAAFVAGVDGDPHGVVGISLPLLRTVLADLGVAWPSLWSPAARA
ncbi:MAG TPA: Maf family protein [Actinotalea caeni]|uniref:Maf family protein n=1 Tax=Actinotalea caeni TaxID=1348467 RepID=UPI002B4B7917|nr:Maf family protein [Actinotalea caeni]HLV55591.1 Maf family protein [Actinotalea caeni]